MVSTIRVGDFVSGNFGALSKDIPAGKKRRTRSEIHGYVIASAANKSWMVYWCQYGRCCAHSSKTLKKKPQFQGFRRDFYDRLDVADLEKNYVVKDIRVFIDNGARLSASWYNSVDHTSPTIPPSPEDATERPRETLTQPRQPSLPRPVKTPTVAPKPSAASNPTTPTVITNSTVAPPTAAPPSVATDSFTDSLREGMSDTTTDPSLPTDTAVTPSSTDESSRSDPSDAAGTPSSTDESDSSDEDGASPDEQITDDIYDPASVEAELKDECRHTALYAAYLAEKQTLIGATVTAETDHRKRKEDLIWTVRADVTEAEAPPHEEFNQVGVVGVDWKKQDVRCGERNKYKRMNLLELIIHFWPGDWRNQLIQLNVLIRNQNKEKKRNGRVKARAKLMKEISEREFWIFFGMMIVARSFGRKGEIWDGNTTHEGEVPVCNYSKHMTKDRFKAIRSMMPHLFADETKKGTDPWYQILKGIEGFNNNRMETVWASYLKVVDESMSAYRPRTTKHGTLPHLSWVMRKPEPLGTEFKVVCDSETGILLHLELMRGKDEMAKAQYAKDYKATCCTLVRMKEATARTRNEGVGGPLPVPKETYLGDSWFTTVQAAVQIALRGAHYIGVIKTGYKGYPKKYISERMRHWPGGSHIVLETKTPEGVELIAVGYKYNKKKIIHFIATKGAGNTEPGTPYEARWKDENGNTMSRDVNRPQLVSKYFEYSNRIDTHNQSRQHDLRLEKHWVTNDGFFRIATTLFGITVTDAWLAYKHHLANNHRHKDLSVHEFAAIVCKDCLDNKFSSESPSDGPMQIVVPARADLETVLSTLTNPGGGRTPSPSHNTGTHDNDAVKLAKLVEDLKNLKATHVLVKHEDQVAYEQMNRGKRQCGSRTKRGNCRTCKKKTVTVCKGCRPKCGAKGAWFCEECHRDHVKELELEYYLEASGKI